MITIKITDTNTKRYTYTASANILGRRYDNIAEYVTVIKPESETGRDCIMIVTYGDTVVDHIPVGDTPIAITSNLSQYASVKIGFAFLGADGYIKNSEVKQFYFLIAQKPDGFVPLPPVQKTTIDYLISHGFTGAKLENNILSFTNAAGEAVAGIKLSGFIQEQADWKETDPTAETYIKNKPTKLSEFTDDLGAYVKPESGIPETDLSAEVQAKLNAGGAEKNLLKEQVDMSLIGETEETVSYLNYPLNLVLGKKYEVIVELNQVTRVVSGIAVNFKEGSIEAISIGTGIIFDDAVAILIVDGIKESDTIKAAIILQKVPTFGDVTISILSITEVEEVVADKLKHTLTIVINGQEYVFDGSADMRIEINTAGGNLLKQSYVLNRQAGVTQGDMVNLGYSLGLEVGKQYKVKYTFNGETVEAVAKYEAESIGLLTGATYCLCQNTTDGSLSEVTPMIIGVSTYNVSAEASTNVVQYGFIYIVDKHKIIGDQEFESDDNNAAFYTRALQSANAGNAVALEILSIEEAKNAEQ